MPGAQPMPSLRRRATARVGAAATVAALALAALQLAAPAGAAAEEPTLQMSVLYIGEGSFNLDATQAEVTSQARSRFEWDDLFPTSGAIDLAGPHASGPGVGGSNSNGEDGFLVDGLPTTSGGEFSASQTSTRGGSCGASGELESRPPVLSITPEMTEQGQVTAWRFEIKEAGRFRDASPASGDDCGLLGHVEGEEGLDDVFWDNWVDATQSEAGDQIDQRFTLSARELGQGREIVLPVSYKQALNAEGWGGEGSDFCTGKPAPCTVSFAWSGTITLKITTAGGVGSPPSGSGGGSGHGAPPGTGPASGHSGPGGSAACVVPRLKGRKLGQARRLLAAHHCKLGKVKRRRAGRSHRGRVLAQSKRPGRRLAAEAKVAVTVGRGAAGAHRKRHRRGHRA